MNGVQNVSSPPRRLPAGTLGKIMKASMLHLLLGGIWFVVGVGLTVLFLQFGNPLDDYYLSRGSETAEGTVVGVTLKRTTRVGGRNPWVIDYTFPVGGRVWDGKSFTTSGRVVEGLRPGSAIEVEYLSAKPAVNRARNTRACLFPGLVFIVPGFVVVAGGFIFLLGIQKVLRLQGLLVTGHVAVAQPTRGKVEKFVNLGRKHPVDVRYIFQDGRRMGWQGRTKVYFPKFDLEELLRRDFRVVYDHLDPRKNFAYELYEIDLSEQQ